MGSYKHQSPGNCSGYWTQGPRHGCGLHSLETLETAV